MRSGAAATISPLADVMGAHFCRRTELKRAYVRVADPSLAHDIPDMPLAVDQAPIEVAPDGGQVLATFSPGEAEMTDATTVLWGHPAPSPGPTLPLAIVHQFGRGQCLYLAVNLTTQGFASLWPRMLGRNALRALLPAPSIAVEAPPTVEVVLNRGARRQVLHLLNHGAGAADTTPRSFDVQGIRIWLHPRLGAIRRVTVAGSGDPVPLRREGEGFVLQAPPLGTQMALILE